MKQYCTYVLIMAWWWHAPKIGPLPCGTWPPLQTSHYEGYWLDTGQPSMWSTSMTNTLYQHRGTELLRCKPWSHYVIGHLFYLFLFRNTFILLSYTAFIRGHGSLLHTHFDSHHHAVSVDWAESVSDWLKAILLVLCLRGNVIPCLIVFNPTLRPSHHTVSHQQSMTFS